MTFDLTRRRLMTNAALAGTLALAPTKLFAQARVQITGGETAPLPIAIPNFVAGTPSDTEVGNGVAQVITNNLKRSGLFAPIDQAAFIEKVVNIDAPAAIPELEDHQRAGARHRSHDATKRRSAQGEFRLWDVATGQQLAGQQYFTSRNTGGRIAHIISDQIYERLTGEKGYLTAASSSSTRADQRSAASSGWR